MQSSRKISAGKPYDASLFGAVNSHTGLAFSLAEALFELRSACSQYVGLETKIYTRLLLT